MELQELTASLVSAASYEVMQIDLASEADRITIDMDTRKITADSNFGKQYDHLAKTKVIDVTRYVSDTDLSTQTAALHWENGDNGGVHPLTEMDLSEPGRIRYRWPLSNEFTQYAGRIVFALHFYTVKTGLIIYHISSNIYEGKIGSTFNASDHSAASMSPSKIEECIQTMYDISAAIDAQVTKVNNDAVLAEKSAASAAQSEATASKAASEAVAAKVSADASAKAAEEYLAQTRQLAIANAGDMTFAIDSEKNCVTVSYTEEEEVCQLSI